MLDFLILVILVAIFFGISLTAALHGILQVILWIIVISVVLTLAFPFLEKFWHWFTTPAKEPNKTVKPIQPKLALSKSAQAKYKKSKENKSSSIIGWVIYFIVSYFITSMFIVIFQDRTGTTTWYTSLPHPIGIIIEFLLPCIPFIVTLAYSLIKKHVGKKNQRASH